MNKSELQPKVLFDFFEEVCQVPRPSNKEEKIRAYLRDFAAKHNLAMKEDEAGNILIKKPATPGMENLKTVILQSHMDMVCEKNKETVHNFETDPIRTYIDGEWMKAEGTTLGADNGIGVATELAILASDDIKHGPVECLFTVDEETGLTGAFALQPGFMEGDILLNLDSEDEGELFIGCAGGVNSDIQFTHGYTEVPAGYHRLSISVKGLTGGHSGDDINKKRANANKLLARFLYICMQKYDMYLCEIDGGNLHNAIPREAHAVIAVPEADKENVRVDFNVFASDVENEYSVTEPNVKFVMETAYCDCKAIDRDTTARLVRALQGAWHGVFAMSQDIDNFVETSTNLASIKMIEGDRIKIVTSQRSSILSARTNVANTVKAVFELAGAEVVVADGYPGWKPNPDSEILHVAVESYKRLFGEEPKVKAIHAGLECGLFMEKYPNLDMVSFGPTLRGVHSPDERMHIPAVEKYWRHLLDILVNIPVK